MKETLTCSSCTKTWKREKARGRKPVLCPKCVKKQSVETKDKPIKKLTTSIIEQPEVIQEPLVSNEEEIKNIILAVYNDFYPHPNGYKDFEESTKNGSHWHCPSCKKELTIGVPLIAPPTHRCPPNSTRVKEYERTIE